MSERFTEDREYYAIKYTRDDGGYWLAYGNDGTTFLAYNRKAAVKFRDELIPHINKKGKIVKVRVRIEELP